MKVFLKFIILCAWLLFVAALWQSRQAPATSLAVGSLPSLGMLSISRKMTDAQPAAYPLPDQQSVAWPAPELLIVIPATGQ